MFPSRCLFFNKKKACAEWFSVAQSIWACQQRMRRREINLYAREKKRIARQAKIRRVRELPRLRKRYIKSGRGGEERKEEETKT